MDADDTLEKVTMICLEALELNELAPDADLVAAGMDSLAAVQIVNRLEALFGIDVLETIIDEPTIAAVAATIRTPLAEPGPTSPSTT